MFFYILLIFHYVATIESYFKIINCHHKCAKRLNLYKNIDFSSFSSSSTFISNSYWDFGLLESNDMKSVVDLSVEAFFNPRLTIKSDHDNMNIIEKSITKFIINSFTSFEILDAKWSNYLGFATRGGSRLSSPNLNPSKDSIIFAATEKGNSNIVGVVEISLEPVDGKLGKPVKFPWNRNPNSNDEAYLCNLCVAKSQRRKGLALLLCQLCEEVVSHVWKKEYIYLHVERNNIPAQELYVGIGYDRAESPLTLVERQTANMQGILYYRKKVRSDSNSSSSSSSDLKDLVK